MIGHLEVDGQQPPDALRRDLLERHLRAVGHGREQRELVRRVDPLDVERRVGLRVAELLRAGEDRVERLTGPLHLRQHVVRGSVQDAEHALDHVGREPFAQRAQDRDAAAHAGLEGHVDTS